MYTSDLGSPKTENHYVDDLQKCKKASNYGFDVTPAKLVTKIITERGVCDASEEGLLTLFPEQRVTV